MKTPQVVIEIKGRDVQMSAEEARRVFDQLANIFNVAPGVIVKEAPVEHHYHTHNLPVFLPYTVPGHTDITCRSESWLS